MGEAAIVPWAGVRGRAAEWEESGRGEDLGNQPPLPEWGCSFQGWGRVRFLRKPQAAQNTISVVKGTELSLARWGRGRALPCPTFKYRIPHVVLWGLQALPRLR